MLLPDTVVDNSIFVVSLLADTNVPAEGAFGSMDMLRFNILLTIVLRCLVSCCNDVPAGFEVAVVDDIFLIIQWKNISIIVPSEYVAFRYIYIYIYTLRLHAANNKYSTVSKEISRKISMVPCCLL